MASGRCLPFAWTDLVPVRPRHLVPLAFVAALASFCALPFPWPVVLPIIYIVASLAASARVALDRRSVTYLLVLMPVAFATLHLAYGFGSAWGCLLLAGHKLSSHSGKEPMPAARLRPDYSTITEQPRQGATRLQLAMLCDALCLGRGASGAKEDVAEVACGAGLGLGWLALMARLGRGGTSTWTTPTAAWLLADLRRPRENPYPRLGRARSSFPRGFARPADLVRGDLLLPCPTRRRCFSKKRGACCVPAALLLLATVNPEWTGFHPSPFHPRATWPAAELKRCARAGRFRGPSKSRFPGASWHPRLAGGKNPPRWPWRPEHDSPHHGRESFLEALILRDAEANPKELPPHEAPERLFIRSIPP